MPGRIEALWRSTARVPYTEMVQTISSVVATDAPVAVISLEHNLGRTGWLRDLMYTKDLRFLFHSEGD